jgi:pimeloyl-ACP methyl ester carboxylesterase
VILRDLANHAGEGVAKLARPGFAFRRFWPALVPTARLVAVDLPGFGHSEGRAEMLTPSAMADFLGRFIARLGLGQVHLVAPDVGASAALFLAARQPGAIRSLVVVVVGAGLPAGGRGHPRRHHRGTGH